MRMNRLVLALAPFVLGACSESEGNGNSTVGAGAEAPSGQQQPSAMPPGASTPTATNPMPSGGTPAVGNPGAGAASPGAGVGGEVVGATGSPPPPGPTGAQGPSGASAAGDTGAPGPVGAGTDNLMGGDTAAVSPPMPMPMGDGGAGGSSTMNEVALGSGGNGGAGGGEMPTAPMTCPYTPPEDPEMFPANWTSGDVTVFNDNGGWTWYNDERVVVDAEAGKIVVSSAASVANSETANTNIDAVIHDLATGTNDKMALGSLSYSDDHNNGGILIKAPGEYFVAWAHHNVDCYTYWRNYDNGMWGEQVRHTWGQGCPWGTRPDQITYNNPWKMSAEGRYYNFVRSVETSPNFLVSEDEGQTWEYGGRLTASPQQGYNAGYYKFWGNGVDRIDFFATEAHPRNADTSVFHGYIKDGKAYDSFDQEIDGNLFDGNASGVTEFTRVFQTGNTVGAVALKRLWNFDIARYEDGTIGVLWQGRENECADKNNCNPGHHVAYSRFNGTEWVSSYLVRGGRTLYREQGPNVAWWEEDYLGGAALDPDDPHVIYVSTNIDPRDNSTEYPVNEIWKGVTCDDGATFQWTPLTMNSDNENLRPAVPKWDAHNTAVLWFRGNYQTAQKYDAEVVGILTRE